MNSTKYAHELQKKNLRGEHEARKDRALDSQLPIQDATTA